MDIVDKLKDSYAFLGDPLHREAYEEIEQLRFDVNLLTLIVSVLEGKDDNPTDTDDTVGHPEGSGQGALCY